jgi:hypothetical protein
MSTDLQSLTDELCEGSTAPFGAYVFTAADPRSALPRAVEEEVFGEVFGNSPELLAAEYEPYEHATVFFCVVDHLRRRPAGMQRVVVHSAAGLKTVDDIEHGPWATAFGPVVHRSGIDLDLRSTLDVATLGVARDYRGKRSDGLITLAVNQITVRLSIAAGARWWLSICDLAVLDFYNQSFAEPWTCFTGLEPRRYLDSPLSVPVYGDIEGWRGRIARHDPGLHDLFVHGTGIEAAVAPCDLGEALVALKEVGWPA